MHHAYGKSLCTITLPNHREPATRHQTLMQKQRAYLFINILVIQFLFAIMNILMKLAIYNSISNYVFVVYWNGIASLVIAQLHFILIGNIIFSPTLNSVLLLELLGVFMVWRFHWSFRCLNSLTYIFHDILLYVRFN
jgi:hypothetical protein